MYVPCGTLEVVVELPQPDNEKPSPVRKTSAQSRRSARERRRKSPPPSKAANVMAAGARKGLGGIFRAVGPLTNLRFPVVPVYWAVAQSDGLVSIVRLSVTAAVPETVVLGMLL